MLSVYNENVRTLSKFLVLFTAVALAAPYSSSAYTFASNLGLGASGTEVIALQQTLNASSDTAVASVGPGSPGQETSYFGQKTFDAVKRFQSKYFNEILAPGGLAAPTGFVGPATRAQLAKLSTTAAPTTTAPAAATAPAKVSTTMGPVILPDMPARLELYIADVKKGLVERGESGKTIALIEEKIRDIAPEAKKSLEKFYKQEEEFYKKKQAQAKAGGPVATFFRNSLSTVSSFFVPATAHAAVGLPFGGYVATVMPVCTCGGVVSQIFVFLPNVNVATTNMTLDYVFGTEGFNWHNLPEPGIATLGLYEPVTPTCYIFAGAACVPLPSRGFITPITGSSLIL